MKYTTYRYDRAEVENGHQTELVCLRVGNTDRCVRHLRLSVVKADCGSRSTARKGFPVHVC